MTTSTAARERLARVARAVIETSTEDAIDRLMERLTVEPEHEALKAALLDVGAEAVVREALQGGQV